MPGAELTLIANAALDRVNQGPWTVGGCPAFAPYAFRYLGARGVINTACADADRRAFGGLEREGGITVHFMSAAATTRFELDYGGEFGQTRSMAVRAVGHTWSVADLDGVDIATEWVHLAPLLRTDFPVATVAALAARGHRVSYDGQGLVRVAQTGPLTVDAHYDRELLRFLTVLKLSDDEADVLAGGHGRDRALAELAPVPELVLTHGFRGAEVLCAGSVARATPDRAIAGVQTTGAGDAFMVGYGVARQRGLAPADAAALGARVTCAMLADRKARGRAAAGLG